MVSDQGWTVHEGDSLAVLPTLAEHSVDCVVTDPPYPEVDRPYGRWTEAEWWDLMMGVCREVRRLLKPTGSAMFVLQPNSCKVGSMRGWLWDFMAWVCREWNMVQDVWWWNPTSPPTAHCHRARGGLRPSVKACVWCGPPDCWRDQDAVLWRPSAGALAEDRSDRALRRLPGGTNMRRGRCASVADERGGVTPFNLLPIPNSDSQSSAGASGHEAGTPLKLCEWLVRYLCPAGGIVLDPFAGSGTVGQAAIIHGCRFIGVERIPRYVEMARQRLSKAVAQCPLLNWTLGAR